MLDLAFDAVSLTRGSFSISGLSAAFPRSTHTALIGPPASGKSTLLALLEGTERPASGRVVIGQRDATRMRASARPLFHTARTAAIPGRWSVRHALVAAARSRRGLDYQDRIEEIEKVAATWSLRDLLDRRARELSSGEALRLRLAQILLHRPAVLLAERLFAPATAGAADALEDRFWGQLRADGCTVVHEISRPEELGWADRAMLVDGGSIVATGAPRDLERAAPTAALAALFGPSSVIPILVVGDEVRSALGNWTLEEPTFQGNGVALAHPWQFTRARVGEESDFLFGIEEARFLGWAWELSGLVGGATVLRVWVEADEHPSKGRLLPLRFEPARFRLFPSAEDPRLGVPTDVIPSRSDSR
ncbi:MAG TPA: ATP-binding cassette domain-containing protein [Thermoanaerobaculia bacterium]|nr:ATP-binding cassette domain-containing protein [Thermoanaerobaculia bacterium]